MKKLILSSILAALVALGTTAKAQDYPDEYLGLPGDNLNLYAVMKLFQESETLEGFERNLNNQESRINNLDLNGDNLIDYITVTDYPDGDDHTIVLRVPLGRKDFQDVAVFTVQKFRNGEVQIQLIGDETLYGKNYIIEPNYAETPNPGYMGRPEDRTYVTVVRTTPYEIAYWPVIRYIYMPDYMVWRSSWYWGYYPQWWSPWRPFYWHYYYGYHYNWYDHYYAHYRHWDYCRWNRYNDFYYHGFRAYSPVVQINITKNVYRDTYSRPEQRKDGEALYTRVNPDRGTRSSGSRESSAASRQPASASREAVRSSAEQRTSPQSRGEQSTRAPQSRSTEAARAPQSRSTETSRAPQSRSTETSRAPQSRSTEISKAPQSRSTETSRAPQSRSTEAARIPQSSNRSSQSASAPQSRVNQTARAPQTSSSKSTQGARVSQSSSKSSQSARSSQSSGRSSQSARSSGSSGQRSSAGRSSSSTGRSSSSSSSKSSSSDSKSRSR
jgi:hypothetical protein